MKHELLKHIDIKTYDLEFGSEDPRYNKKNFEFDAQAWADQATRRTKDSHFAGGTSTAATREGREQLSYLVQGFNQKRNNKSSDPNRSEDFSNRLKDVRLRHSF